MNLTILSTWGSPVSTAYLKSLLALKLEDLQISVVYEENLKLAADIQRIYLERFGSEAPVFKSAEEWGIPTLRLPHFRDDSALIKLSSLNPHLFILAGTSIVKSPLLKIPSIGTLNCHPGILPRYRGCTCVEWALYEDEPVGATCHFVTEEIDAGEILLKKAMPVYAGDTYRKVRLRMFHFQAEILAQAVGSFLQAGPGEFKTESFDWHQARYYKPIPEDLFKAACEKIQMGTYLHLITS